MREIKKEHVRNAILVAFFLMSIAMAFQYPKLAGVLSPLGYPLHQMRMEILGATEFKHPSNTMAPIRLAEKERHPRLPYHQYRVCGSCPVPFFFAVTDEGNHTVHVMNIVPKYEYGMRLPAGEYRMEVRRHFEDGKTLYGKRVIDLTPENNTFIYKESIATRGGLFDQEFDYDEWSK